MSSLSSRACVALLSLAGVALLATPAAAEDCTYTDLLGTFEVKVDCVGLKDHSNLGNEQKRMWLGGDWGQVNIIEVPSPYKQDPGQIDLIMSNLGRYYTERRSPGGIQETTVAGQEARVVLEHKMRTSSRSWVFHWEGRNLIMRAVAYGKKKARMENLDAMSAALTSSFTAATMTAAAPGAPVEETKVRDRKVERKEAAEAADTAADAKEAVEETAADAKEVAEDTAADAEDTAEDAGEKAEDTAEDAKEAVEEGAEKAMDKVQGE
ncbi:MAG: YtxH domain-containing protein [Deltaproteobacteria bacterium]|nr:YtxH domain-containing protein [Deltaproteobacteria bacterium]